MSQFLIRWKLPNGYYSVPFTGSLCDAYREAGVLPRVSIPRGEIYQRVDVPRLVPIPNSKEIP